MSDTPASNETTAPSLASRVGAFFDEQHATKAIDFVTKDEPAPTKPASVPAEAPAPVASSDAEAEAPAPDAAETDETPAESEASPPELDAEFTAALERSGVPTSIEEVPEEFRPVVEKKLKDLERGFTKAMQEARSYRQEKAKFDADQQYATEKPASYFADKLLADPSLIERVNEEIEKRNVPAYAEAVARERALATERAQMDAEKTVARTQAAEQAMTARVEHVETHTAQAAKAAGIPYALVEEAVALAVSLNPDLSDEDVTRVVNEKARIYKQHLGANRGAAKRELAKEKASDAKHAGLTDVPSAAARSSASRQSATPNASSDTKPMTLREKLSATLDERLQAA